MMSGTCKITSLYPMICLKFSHKLGNVFFLNWEIWRNLEFRVIFSWHRANHIMRSRLLQNVLTSERYHVHSTLFKTLRRKISISSLYYKNQKHQLKKNAPNRFLFRSFHDCHIKSFVMPHYTFFKSTAERMTWNERIVNHTSQKIIVQRQSCNFAWSANTCTVP